MQTGPDAPQSSHFITTRASAVTCGLTSELVQNGQGSAFIVKRAFCHCSLPRASNGPGGRGHRGFDQRAVLVDIRDFGERPDLKVAPERPDGHES